MDDRLFERYLAQGGRPPTEQDYSELAALVLPRVKSLARGYSVNALDRDGIINQALCVLLQRLSEQAFPLTVLAFDPYMTRAIQNALRNAYRDQIPEQPLSLFEQESVRDPTTGPGDIDPELAAVVRSIADRAYTRNRFGELTPAVFRYIVESLLVGRTVSYPLLQRFGLGMGLRRESVPHVIARCVSHVELLIRMAMYDLEEAIKRDGAF